MEKKLTAIDLFSGAGGLHLGFEESGYDVKLCIDNNDLVEKTHKRNFPHIPMINGDIRDVTVDQIRQYLGGESLDVVIGGPPCQGFSTIGHRASSDPNKRCAHDSRNELVLVYANLIKELKPKFIVMENVKGILLGGGYPELYGKELAENQSMLESIRRALDDKIPCLAECGGFMYLHEEMEDTDGNVWKLVGRIHGRTFPTGKLARFGYVNLQVSSLGMGSEKETEGWFLPGENIRAHEFHYWDSTDSGSDCLAVKPDGKRSWECMHLEENLVVGYPHLYYPSCKEFAERFVEKCRSGYRE